MEQLQRVGRLAKTHWEKHLPTMVKNLKAAGVYEDRLIEVQEQVGRELADLRSRGMDWEMAWELVTQELIFLPPENEEEEEEEEEEED